MLKCSQVKANSAKNDYLFSIGSHQCTITRAHANIIAMRHFRTIKQFHHRFNEKTIRVQVALDEHDKACEIVIEGPNCHILMMSLCSMIRRQPLSRQDIEDLLSYQYSTSECVEIYHQEAQEQLAKL